jgi:hypothetical protein
VRACLSVRLRSVCVFLCVCVSLAGLMRLFCVRVCLSVRLRSVYVSLCVCAISWADEAFLCACVPLCVAA